MRPFEENDRYELPLSAESVVFDVGAHEGNFSALIHQRHGCRVEAFEPVPEFFNRCARRFEGHPKIRVWPFGLGAFDQCATFGVKGDMSGAFCTSPNEFIQVPLRDVASVLDNLMGEFDQVALLKLNCEGAEHEILERLIGLGLERRFTHLQVQPHHVAPDSERRWAAICDALASTHQLQYAEPWIWFGWSLRT